MNLTIPVMEGQTANINIYDSKTKQIFTFSANHMKVLGLNRSIDGKNSTMFYAHDSNIVDENLWVKGFGRNKRFRKPNIKINLTKPQA